MKVASRLLHIFFLGILSKNVHSIRFTAITDIDQRYLNKLYIEEWNRDAPSKLDPATTDPSARQRICEEIINSGFLAELGREPVSMQEIYPPLKKARYNDDFFHRIYRPTDSSPRDRPSFKHINPYTLEVFEIRTQRPTHKSEYTFVCWVKQKDYHHQVTLNTGWAQIIEMEERSEMDNSNNAGTNPPIENEIALNYEENSINASRREDDEINAENFHAMLDSVNWDASDSTPGNGGTGSSGPEYCVDMNDPPYRIFPLYVSKAYDLNHGPRVHRFVFWKDDLYHRVMLAEGSAQVYAKPDFNVELHYLELRKHHQPVFPRSPEFDPVCRLNWGGVENSQLFRLCAIVLTASGFKDTIEYPARLHFGRWWYSRVSFRTPEGLVNAIGETYREMTVECHARMVGGGLKTFHVSRAYNPNEVFVYSEVPRILTSAIYLESLITNVHIVDEPYNLGMVEI